MEAYSIAEMPSHKHQIGSNWAKDKGSGGWGAKIDTYDGYVFEPSHLYAMLENTGGSQAHNNIQPYFCVYIFKRTA